MNKISTNYLPGSGESVRASLASQVKTLSPVGSQGARFTVAIHAKLLSVGALLPAFGGRDGLLGPRGQADAAESARELALLRLELSVAARPAQVHDLVEVLTDRTTF